MVSSCFALIFPFSIVITFDKGFSEENNTHSFSSSKTQERAGPHNKHYEVTGLFSENVNGGTRTGYD